MLRTKKEKIEVYVPFILIIALAAAQKWGVRENDREGKAD